MTNGYKINTGPASSPHVLVTPLDWGLGHTTRCIPIIQLLIDRGCTVTLAASGSCAKLLQREFPNVELVRISGYDLNYSLTTFGTRGKLLLQVPKILTAIKRERQWLDSFVKKRKTDIVISDCRFGMHHPDVYSVFITHQLHIRSPFGKWS